MLTDEDIQNEFEFRFSENLGLLSFGRTPTAVDRQRASAAARAWFDCAVSSRKPLTGETQRSEDEFGA
jgi:hypothetical protein